MSRMGLRSSYSLAGMVCMSGCLPAGHTGQGLEALKPYPMTPHLDVHLQGGVMSLMALRSNYSLAGAVCLSGYLPLATQPPEMSPANERTPVFMCHGDEDNVVRPPSATPAASLIP